MQIACKRAYDQPAPEDGFRILVDRLWPRGLSRERAQIDLWLKDIAPGAELRKWFAPDPAKWPGFKRRYREQLNQKQEQLSAVKAQAKKTPVTLIYGAKDQKHNN